MNRRALLKAVPALALADSVAVAAPVDTPVMKLFWEWKSLDAELGLRRLSGCERDAAVDRMIMIMNRIVTLPAQSAQDFVAKVVAYTSFGEGGLPGLKEEPEFWAEARAMLAA